MDKRRDEKFLSRERASAIIINTPCLNNKISWHSSEIYMNKKKKTEYYTQEYYYIIIDDISV